MTNSKKFFHKTIDKQKNFSIINTVRWDTETQESKQKNFEKKLQRLLTSFPKPDIM